MQSDRLLFENFAIPVKCQQLIVLKQKKKNGSGQRKGPLLCDCFRSALALFKMFTTFQVSWALAS